MFKKAALVLLCLYVYACEDIIAVEDISEETVTILAPTNNVTLGDANVNFAWQPVAFADRYHLQIATPNFEASQQLVEDTLITSSNFTKILPSNDYQWRVKAINFTYETQFTTQNLSVED
ncbi:hypothetical protein [uncultured Psychroserpens sp.]|uniref:hypothetical protein n=1 Tax=uncultured Psychroserpens sp. TaxID=255436 RepID=UPI002630924A|nr:hypothetical protein [uncultured Psychroserpens sp.]